GGDAGLVARRLGVGDRDQAPDEQEGEERSRHGRESAAAKVGTCDGTAARREAGVPGTVRAQPPTPRVVAAWGSAAPAPRPGRSAPVAAPSAPSTVRGSGRPPDWGDPPAVPGAGWSRSGAAIPDPPPPSPPRPDRKSVA